MVDRKFEPRDYSAIFKGWIECLSRGIVLLYSRVFARLPDSKSLHSANECVLQVVNPQLYSSPHACAEWSRL